jgi:glycosyltransferase involved in cell wall biosynthesis
MRIALFVPAPFDTVSGGYAYDRAIVAGLRAAGHEVAVRELTGQHPLPDAAAAASARDAWAQLAPDTVPVIDGLCLAAFAAHADALAARGAVALIHHPTALAPGHDDATHAALRAVERAVLGRLARIIVTGAPIAERLTHAFGVDPARISVVVPGTAPAPRSEGSGGPGCAILSVGVLTRRKGHDVLLRALALLPDLDWTLTIAGAPRDAAHAAMLVALAEELRIAPRVTFAGEATADVLATLWQRADLFALATRFEGYGTAVAEALRRGVPVAVTDGGAVAALVTPETGIVAAIDDHAALSRALRRMIFDTALRTQMRDAAWTAGRALPEWPAQTDAFVAALSERN